MKYYRIMNEAKKSVDTTTLGDKVDDLIDKADKMLDDPITEVTEDDDVINSALDDALRVARKTLKKAKKYYEVNGKWPDGLDFVNVLLVGEAGCGKTQRVREWASSRGINLVTKQAATMDELDVGGGVVKGDDGKMIRIPTDEFDELDETANSVLFLDELNRASGRVRGTLLTLIQDHKIPDGKNMRFLQDMLFTVASINPSAAAMGYDVQELDPAELSRFYRVDVISDPRDLLKYLNTVYDTEIKEADDDEDKLEALRKKELATKILSDKRFSFDSADEVAELSRLGRSALNSRSFTNLLNNSFGEKSIFIRKWPGSCNPNKLDTIKSILTDYEDVNLDDFEEVDDKATSVLKKKPEDTAEEEHETVFAKDYWSDAQSFADRIRELADSGRWSK